MSKPRILFNAKDAPTLASGYGIIGKHLLPRLAKHYGKDALVLFAPVHFRDGLVKEWEGIKVVSGFRGDYHDDMMLDVYRRENATMLLMVGDWFHFRALPDHARDNPDFLWVQWAPWDYLRVPPEVTQLLKFAMYVVPFGEEAERRLRAASLPNVLPGIPLGVEPAIWHPLKPEDYRLAFQSCGFEDGAVNFLIVSANQQRKYVREQLEGIALWRKGTPGAKVRLYLHGNVEGDRNFQDDLRDAGLDDVSAMPNPYDLMQGGFSEETMNRVFNSASILLNAAPEGWGLSVTQAQAVGRPVIGLSEGGASEQVLFGEVTSPGHVDYTARLTKAVPDPIRIAAAIESIVQKGVFFSPETARRTAEKYNWDRIAEQWIAVIDRVHAERESLSLYIPEPDERLKAPAAALREVTP